MKKFSKIGMVLGVLALGSYSALAQDPPPNANTILTNASSAATSVMGLCVTIGTFFAVFKVVKWIRK